MIMFSPAVEPVRDRARQRAEQQGGQQRGQPDAADRRVWAAAPLPASERPARSSASRLSQSPRLDSDVAIHSRRNGLMDSTLRPAAPAGGDRKFTALGYRSGLATRLPGVH